MDLPTTVTTLAGHLVLAPGEPVPNIVRRRPRGLSALFVGQTAEAWPARLASVYTVCGMAHRLTATLAVAAARGAPATLSPAAAQALRRHTAVEQMRRLLLDWPSRQPGGPDPEALAVLRGMPAWVSRSDADAVGAADVARGSEPDAVGDSAWTAWLQSAVLRMPPTAWLESVARGGEDWLAQWCEATPGPVPALLAAARPQARRVSLPVTPLCLRPGLDVSSGGRLPAGGATAFWLAARLRADGPAFADAPVLPGGPVETGPWTRAADPMSPAHHNAWMRLVSRLRDAVQLGQDRSAAWLGHGSCTTAAGEGLAWVEMARGVLLHWVRLVRDADGVERVAACRVLSPTDWNFHPAGPLARALAELPRGRPPVAGRAAWLVAAYDACVPATWASEAVGGDATAGDDGFRGAPTCTS